MAKIDFPPGYEKTFVHRPDYWDKTDVIVKCDDGAECFYGKVLVDRHDIDQLVTWLAAKAWDHHHVNHWDDYNAGGEYAR